MNALRIVRFVLISVLLVKPACRSNTTAQPQPAPTLQKAGPDRSKVEYFKAQVTWGYVFDIGDANAITRWGLSQTDAQEVARAQNALRDLIVLGDENEMNDAANGYVAIHQKLLGGEDDPAASYVFENRPLARPRLIVRLRAGVRDLIWKHPQNEAGRGLLREMERVDEVFKKENEKLDWFK